MPDAGGHLTGDPDDFRRMLEAFEERNAVAEQHEGTMAKLVESVTSLALSVQVLRDEVARRPTKHQLDHRRRSMVAGIIALVALSTGLGTLNTDHCGPGYRAERAVAALGDGERDPSKIALAGRPMSSPACDTIVPVSAHGTDPFPNHWNVLGWTLYALAALGLLLYRRGPKEESPVRGAPAVVNGRRSTDPRETA